MLLTTSKSVNQRSPSPHHGLQLRPWLSWITLAAWLLSPTLLSAQSVWTGEAVVGPDRWNRPGNWTGGLPPVLPFQNALFGDIPGPTNVAVRAFGGGAASISPGTLTFTNLINAYTITLPAGSQLRPTEIVFNGTQEVTFVGPGLLQGQLLNGGNLRISGSGPSLVTMISAISDGLLSTPTRLIHARDNGITVLSGANTYSGGTSLESGTLLLGNNQALGTGLLELAPAVTIGLAPGSGPVSLDNDLLLNGDIFLRAAAGDFLEFAGTVNLQTEARTITLTEDGSDICFSGVIAGNAGLTLQAAPGVGVTVEICGPDPNTFTGPLIIGNNVQVQLTKDPGVLAVPGDLTIQTGGFLQLFEDLAQIAPTSSVTVNGTLELFRLGLAGSDTAQFTTLNGTGTVTNSLTTATLNIASGNFQGVIQDPGLSGNELSLIKSGPGTLILGGSNTYSGNTSVTGGLLQVDGSIQSPIVTIGNGATLGGSGTIAGAVTILNGGLLSPGSSPGILTVGTLTLSPGSITLFEINGTTPGTQHDQIIVTGNANLDGTAQILFGGGFTPANGTTLTLLQAGAINGQFANFTSNLGAAFTLSLTYNPTTLQLLIAISQQDFTLFALNENQLNVAANLDTFSRTGQMPELIALLNTLDAANLANALQQISPDSLGAMNRMARHFNRSQGRNLFNRLHEWRESGGGIAGTVSTSSLRLMDWAAQPLYAGTRMRDYTPVSLDSVANPSWSLFASGTGQFGDIEGDGNGIGYHFKTGGMTIGADKTLGKLFEGDLVAGVYAGYAGSEARLDNAGGRIDLNGGKFGVFGSWVKEGLYLNAQTGGGVSDYDTRRNVLGQRQNGSTTGYEFIAESAIGHEWRSHGWRFGPEGSLSYSYVGINRFTETGGLAPLQIQDQDIHSLQTRLGWRTSYEFVGQNGWWLRPGLNASWAHEFLSTAQAIDARLASGAGGLFTSTPTRVGRDTAIAGANLTLGQGQRWNAWLAYEAETGHNLLVHTINAGAAINF